jgi:tetratricopeptide (TPR) repeat protein
MRDFDGFFDSAIALCEATDHPDRDCLLGNIYHILGTASYEMNDKDESRRCMEKSLELQRKVCDEEGIVDERLAMAYAERGLTKMQDGKYEECITDYEKDREIRESLGTYFPTSKEGNLASAYMALGRLDEADRVLSPAIEKRVERYGELGKESFRFAVLDYRCVAVC